MHLQGWLAVLLVLQEVLLADASWRKRSGAARRKKKAARSQQESPSKQLPTISEHSAIAPLPIREKQIANKERKAESNETMTKGMRIRLTLHPLRIPTNRPKVQVEGQEGKVEDDKKKEAPKAGQSIDSPQKGRKLRKPIATPFLQIPLQMSPVAAPQEQLVSPAESYFSGDASAEETRELRREKKRDNGISSLDEDDEAAAPAKDDQAALIKDKYADDPYRIEFSIESVVEIVMGAAVFHVDDAVLFDGVMGALYAEIQANLRLVYSLAQDVRFDAKLKASLRAYSASLETSSSDSHYYIPGDVYCHLRRHVRRPVINAFCRDEFFILYYAVTGITAYDLDAVPAELALFYSEHVDCLADYAAQQYNEFVLTALFQKERDALKRLRHFLPAEPDELHTEEDEAAAGGSGNAKGVPMKSYEYFLGDDAGLYAQASCDYAEQLFWRWFRAALQLIMLVALYGEKPEVPAYLLNPSPSTGKGLLSAKWWAPEHFDMVPRRFFHGRFLKDPMVRLLVLKPLFRKHFPAEPQPLDPDYPE